MYDEAVQRIECRSFSGACVRHAGRMENIREHGRRNLYDYTKEIPVKKDILLRSNSTVDWIKG